MMRVLFAGQVPKDPTCASANEDRFQIDLERGRIAVSDGASESFDSKTWAELLVKQFVSDPAIGKSGLAHLANDYASRFDLESLSWSKQAAFERGSFATLLGIEHIQGAGAVNVFGVGDSLAVLIDRNGLIDAYPYSSALEFQQRPELFSTLIEHNSFVEAPDFITTHGRTWRVVDKQGPVLLCMTDALAEWALKLAEAGHPPWHLLAAINDLALLEALVSEARAQKRMRVDDVTLVSVVFDEGVIDELPVA